MSEQQGAGAAMPKDVYIRPAHRQGGAYALKVWCMERSGRAQPQVLIGRARLSTNRWISFRSARECREVAAALIVAGDWLESLGLEMTDWHYVHKEALAAGQPDGDGG